jgi:hypothetical protein
MGRGKNTAGQEIELIGGTQARSELVLGGLLVGAGVVGSAA